MLYYLFSYLDAHFDLPGAGVFQYISFRAAMAAIVSLVVSMLFGKRIIRLLHSKQVGEPIRKLGLEGQEEKEGTPTMGGLVIISAILIPTLLFAKVLNVYIILMIVTTIWLGAIGFIDDYIKVFKRDKKGLAGKFKVLGQITLGLIVGSVLYFHKDVTIRDKQNMYYYDTGARSELIHKIPADASMPINGIDSLITRDGTDFKISHDGHSTKTTIPFFKNNELEYAHLLRFLGDGYEKWAWLIFIPIVILIVTSVSNGANITDGLDGLATGTAAIIGATLAVFAYVSGNTIFADYLNIMYIPNSGELVIFISAFVGACIGFLWYNSFPAQVFMGDTGSLAIGGIIAVFAIAVRKELLIPILCGIFLMENLSVVMQVSYFKYTKKKYGEGRRIFKMSPLHHHYQKLGYHESKIATRFWIIGIMLAIVTIVTLKLR
ncbi:MAG: phospho-N-acetylmuramoyl-pentapeptide-transferase [Flavobacteriales bacterium]|nr:phospho-N-acetylmuramoyl-pentapeptide-transferase [Flavobacteriales bacterium]MCB9449365.1 phospho-N-acetylmuramoyl-pentapeptide-transferase [Flavobacteriales bacterium]